MSLFHFGWSQNGPLIRYSFTNPDEILQLRLGENSSRLDLVSGGEAGKFSGFEARSKNPRHRRDVRGPVLQISLLAEGARLGRGKCSHSQLLETSTAPTLARIAVFKCVTVGR